MPNVKVVIGANFGDEGKGLMTDYFCHKAISNKETCIVALSNGGAQRGHTVVTPENVRHVFHHFGSGTLVGADTYLSEMFILNPMTFRKEYEELEAMGFTPKVYAHWNCRWTTPFDMMMNQILEESRGDMRHGSCGMGIWETIIRYRTSWEYQVWRFNKFGEDNKFTWLKELRDTYFTKRIKEEIFVLDTEWSKVFYNNALIYRFIDDIAFMCNHITWCYSHILNDYQNVIFENGQGLLLDQNQTKYGDNTTPSNTGLENPNCIIEKFLPNANVEVCYVTRTYLTRHGAGRFDEECDKSEINSSMEDKTNVPNPHQGSLRYGYLNKTELVNRIKKDVTSATYNDYKVSLAITHVNEFCNKELLNQKDFAKTYTSYGETRNDFKE